jgi:hypothetical protein
MSLERAEKTNRIQIVVRNEFPDAIGFVVFRGDKNFVEIEMATSVPPEVFGMLLSRLGNEMEDGLPPDSAAFLSTDGGVTMDPFANGD